MVFLHALNAALLRNPANVAAALAAVLGSRTVEMPAAQNLIIHGPRVSRLVKVRNGETELSNVYSVGGILLIHNLSHTEF